MYSMSTATAVVAAEQINEKKSQRAELLWAPGEVKWKRVTQRKLVVSMDYA